MENSEFHVLCSSLNDLRKEVAFYTLKETEHGPASSASSLQGPNVRVFRLACLKLLCAIWFVSVPHHHGISFFFLLSLERPIIDSDPFSTELVFAREVLRNIVQLMPDVPTVMSQ